MLRHMAFCSFILISFTIDAQTINVHGFVSNKAGKPVSNAIVTLVRQGLRDTTGTDGAYSIVKTGIAVLPARVPDAGTILFDKGILELSLHKPSAVKVEIFDAQGSLLKDLSHSAAAGVCRLKILDNLLAANLLIIRVSIGRRTILFRYLPPNRGKYAVYASGENATPVGEGLARMPAAIDSLKTAASGYLTKMTVISSYDQAAVITLDSVASFAFLSPSANAIWTAGSSYQIEWAPSSSGPSDLINLYLHKGAQSLSSIVSSVSNSGVYTYSLPSGLSTGNDYRIRITNNASPIKIGFSDFFTINAITAIDVFEPDNNRQTASTIDSLGKTQAYILTVNDTDWVKFSADSGSIYQLTLSGTVSVAASLYLGSSSASSASFGGQATSSLKWTCPKSNTWYVRISSYSAGGSGTYSFTVSRYNPAGWVHFINPAAKSVLTAGTSNIIAWSVDSSHMTRDNFNLYLCKGSRQFFPINAQVTSGAAFTWNIPEGVATGSDYRIGIVNRSRTVGEGFSDTFSITGMTPDSYEPDDSKTLAHPLYLPAQTHTLTVNDTDWFNVWVGPGPDNGPIPVTAIKIVSANKAVAIKVENSSNQDWNITTVADSSAMMRLASTTYCRVTSPSVGAYTISVADYPDSAFTLHFSSPKSGDTLSIGQSVSVSWSCQECAGGYYDIILLDGSFKTYDTLASNVAVNGTFQWSIGTNVKAGDYYIRVGKRYSGIGSGRSEMFTVKE